MTWTMVSDNILHLSNHASNTKALTLDNHDTFDILADHQDCNHKLKVPSPDHLHHSVAHHKHWPKWVVDSDEEEVVPDSEGELELDDMEENLSDSEEPSRKHTKCNSAHHCAKLTQLQFYPGTWADILERAKEFFHLCIIEECPFPEHDENLPNTQNALEKAMEEFKAKDCEVEDSRCKSICHNIFS